MIDVNRRRGRTSIYHYYVTGRQNLPYRARSEPSLRGSRSKRASTRPPARREPRASPIPQPSCWPAYSASLAGLGSLRARYGSLLHARALIPMDRRGDTVVLGALGTRNHSAFRQGGRDHVGKVRERGEYAFSQSERPRGRPQGGERCQPHDAPMCPLRLRRGALAPSGRRCCSCSRQGARRRRRRLEAVQVLKRRCSPLSL